MLPGGCDIHRWAGPGGLPPRVGRQSVASPFATYPEGVSAVKASFDASDLTAAVAWTAKFAASNPAVPAYTGILIDAMQGDRVVLTCMDQTTTGRRTVGGNVATPGKCLVTARLFAELLAKLPQSGTVDLALESDQLSVVAGRSRFRLRQMDVEDFPAGHRQAADTADIQVPGPAFAGVVSRVAPASSTEPSRPALTGLHFELADGRVTLAATDSYRLAAESFPVDSDASDMTMLVPAKAAALAARSAEQASTATLSFEPASYRVVAGDMEVSGALLEAQFPSWRALIPSTHNTSFVVEVAAMREVVDRFTVLAAASKAMIPVKLRVVAGEPVEVSADHPDLGDGVDHVTADVTGESVVIAFNPVLLAQTLDSMPTSRARFDLVDGLKPALVMPAADTIDGVARRLWLVMTVRPGRTFAAS